MALKYLAEQPPVVPFRAAEPPPPLPADVEAPLPPDDAVWGEPIATAPRDGTYCCVTDNPVARPDGAVATWRTRRVNTMVGKSRQWVPVSSWVSPRTLQVVPFEPVLWKPATKEMWW